jgi:hypothetical protein
VKTNINCKTNLRKSIIMNSDDAINGGTPPLENSTSSNVESQLPAPDNNPSNQVDPKSSTDQALLDITEGQTRDPRPSSDIVKDDHQQTFNQNDTTGYTINEKSIEKPEVRVSLHHNLPSHSVDFASSMNNIIGLKFQTRQRQYNDQMGFQVNEEEEEAERDDQDRDVENPNESENFNDLKSPNESNPDRKHLEILNMPEHNEEKEAEEDDEESVVSVIQRQAKRITALENVVIEALTGAENLSNCLNDTSNSLLRAAEGSSDTVNQLVANLCKNPLKITKKDMLKIVLYVSIECLTEATQGSGSTSLGYREYDWGNLDDYDGESISFRHLLRSIKDKVETATAEKRDELLCIRTHNQSLKDNNEALRNIIKERENALESLTHVPAQQNPMAVTRKTQPTIMTNNSSYIEPVSSFKLPATSECKDRLSAFEALSAPLDRTEVPTTQAPPPTRLSTQPPGVLASLKRAQQYNNEDD